jgi:RecB family endonuclease NucS
MPREELLAHGPVFDEKTRGTIFHEAMDMAAARGGALEPAAAVAAARAACSVTIPEKAEAELEEALRWALEHDELSAYLAAGAPEASIMDEGGRLHRPDLLARGDFGTCVLEYKTGTEQHEHLEQVRRYMNLLETMQDFPKPVYGVIAYLDLKRLVRVEARS